MPALTLLIPNPVANRIAEHESPHPALEAFLARCVPTIEPATSSVGWICAQFGIERQQDWPAGAILAQADSEETGSTFWICAQPVHLAVNRDELVLMPPAQLHLPDAQSKALFCSVETHCAEHGLEMRYIDAGMWCIGSRRAQDLSTTEIECVEGRSVGAALAAGSDAHWWQRLIVELQMVLHEHPVNIARERNGEAPVNSVWIWGGGSTPDVHHHFDTMCVEQPLLRAMARLSRARTPGIPCHIDRVLDDERGLVEFANAADVDIGTCLSRLEAEWMAPAWEALAKGSLKELNMVFALPEGLVTCRCDRRARRRFWKRRSALRRQIAHWKRGP